jgi:hypothetical protein
MSLNMGRILAGGPKLIIEKKAVNQNKKILSERKDL